MEQTCAEIGWTLHFGKLEGRRNSLSQPMLSDAGHSWKRSELNSALRASE